MRIAKAIAMFAVLALVAGPAIAKNQGKWPKNAVALTSDETKALFAEHTLDFKDTLYYMAADGSLIGYHTDKKGDGFADGKWAVTDNEFCLNSSWHGEDKAAAPFLFTWCNKIMKAKNVVWAQNTNTEDKYLNDIYTGLDKKLKAGDLISAKVAALKAKYGY